MKMEQIGTGGYSTVWLPVLLEERRKHYVIKKPKAGLPEKERGQVIKKYRQQKQVLDHLRRSVPQKALIFFPKIRINQADGSAYMSDLGETTLHEVINKQYFVLFKNLKNVWKQLKAGVLAMIMSGVAHRDIKDGNIMAWRNLETTQFRIVFIDFSDSVTKEKVETLDNFVNFGTKEYMSPELLKRRCDNNTHKGSWDEYVANDLWALGIVLYRMLYNKNPINMFKQKYPEFWAPFRNIPQCTSNNKKVTELLAFYNEMREYPEIYDQLFLPIEGKEALVNEAKELLSLDPQRRLAWRDRALREVRQRRTSTKRAHQQQRQTSTSARQQQRQTKRAKSATTGIQMLLRAASALQEKKNKTPQK